MGKLVQAINTYLPKDKRNIFKRVAVFLLVVNMLFALPVALEQNTFADDVIVGSAAYANTMGESENVDNGDALASSSDAELALNNTDIDDSSDVSESDALLPVSSSDENNASPAADFGELKIIIKTTPEAVGKDLNFSFSGYGAMYADFGDGNIVECGFDNISKGTVIKVYSTGDITTMYCYEKEVIELDVSRCELLEDLYCGGDGMRTGKLNKLSASGCTSLKTLECFDCELTSLDVSGCINLVSIDCSEALLESIDLSGCGSLEKLVCDDNSLEILDVSDCSNLLSLSCDYNNLSKIDVSKNTNLKSLSCFNNNLTEIDVSKNVALSDLDCGGNELTEIDVSKNAALSSFSCDENNLTEIDVSQNINLKSLSCDSNNLTKVDVSKNAVLTDLNVAHNKLTEVNVADNSELQWLFCDGNGLTELDISKNTKLYYLSFAENNLTEIDLSNQKSLEMLYCDSNNLTGLTVYSDLMIDASGAKNCFRFSTMPIEFPEWDWIGGGSLTHRYAPQQDIKIASQIKEDEAIDISSEYDINGTKTVYTWYDAADDSVVTPTTANNGVFTFGEKYAGKKVYCQMTNDLFPYLTLKTTVVIVGVDVPNLGEPKIIMSTETAIGGEISFVLTFDSIAFIDYGDGNPVRYSDGSHGSIIEGIVAGPNIKIYSEGNITKISLGSDDITSLDVSGCPNLEYLDCMHNKLTSLDVSGCPNLEYLDCMYNKLTSLDLSNCPNIYFVNCMYNELTELNLNGCNKVSDLWCSSNKLTSLEVISEDICCVWCDANNLTSLNVVGVTDQSTVWCSFNGLKFSDLPLNIDKISEVGAHGSFYEGYWDGISGYGGQEDIAIPESLDVGAKLTDLSSEYDINGTKTVYTWHNAADDSVVTPATAESGVFTFGDELVGKTLYCTMTNELFPGLTLKTTVVTVGSAQVPDTSFEVDDNTSEDAVVDAEPGEKFSCVDENNNLVDVSGLKLIVGNVAENSKKTVAEAIAKYNKQFDVEQNNYAMYDISLVDAESGAKVEVTEGKIKITLKVPDNFPGKNKGYTFNLYHYKDNGAVEEIPITFNNDGNSYYFYADDFSPYVLIWTEKTSGGSSTTDGDKSPTTGEDIYKNYAVLAVLLNLMLASMTVMWFVYDRHREFFVSKANLVAAKIASKETDASIDCVVCDETDSDE